MESEAAPAETGAVEEAKPTRARRASTRPGTRKAKRDLMGDQASTPPQQTS